MHRYCGRCETLPCAILLLVTLLRTGRWPPLACISIVLAWIATAHKTASVAFGIDTDPKRRRMNPGEPSPGAEEVGVGPVPVQMWAG
jgi:hypothetical protein